MSRMVTSVASLSWARPAMRCACSSGVSGSPAPGRRASRFEGTTVAIEPNLLDHACDGRRDEAVDRLAAGDARSQVAGGDRDRLELEEGDAIGVLEARADVLEPVVRDARPGRDGESHVVEDAVRLAPGREVGELVRAEEEHDAVAVPPLGPDGRVDGVRRAAALELDAGKLSVRE